MYSLEEFLAEYGEAARRMARNDEMLHECLVIPFSHYLEAYNGVWGTPGGYILMRLKYALLKAHRRQYLHAQKHSDLPDEVHEREQQPLFNHPQFNELFMKIDPDMQLVLEMWVYGRTQQEISDELDIGMRKVRARVAAGLQQLKDQYDAL